MELKKIEEKLIKNGYLCFFHERIETLYCSVDNGSGEPKLDTTSKITFVEGKYRCEYYNRNLELVESFDSMEKVLSFIQSTFN
jgi:hypothetical protein